jgi:hypothetical protein
MPRTDSRGEAHRCATWSDGLSGITSPRRAVRGLAPIGDRCAVQYLTATGGLAQRVARLEGDLPGGVRLPL